jgi:pentatricopeptide repeat domain-containing protein 1
MRAAGVQPTVITYNALISAYEKGAQWERAKAAFEEMKAVGVQPTVITYSALISAYGKGAQWERARATFEEMRAVGVQPDRPTYNPLLTVLWKCDQRRAAIELYTKASAAGVYPSQAESKLNKIDLHEMSAGAAQAATTLWLEAIVATSLERPAALPQLFTVVTGQGHGSRVTGESVVKDAVTSFLLEELGSPFKAPENNAGRLEADQAAVCAWLAALGPVAERVCGDKSPGP